MRRSSMFLVPVLALICLAASAHVGMPPQLPDLDETAPATISASATDCDVTGTSWCLYSVASDLKCTKNGNPVTLSFNSITTNSPHQYHVDKTWNVDLTTLNLQSGDTLVWEYSCWATAGPFANRKIRSYKTTQVQ